MKKKIQTFLEKRGYYFFKPSKLNGSAEFQVGNFSYGVNFPRANFAPWKNDQPFIEVFRKASSNTLVDVYRCYELWQLADQVLKISDELNVIEIGVWRGGTGAVMARKMQMRNGKGKIYLADTFKGVVKTGEKDSFYYGGEHQDTSIGIVEKLLKDLGLNNFKILVGIFPDETAHLIPDNTLFGLCHIDVDVYLSAKGCLDWVWDKLVPGGIVVFDDYGFHTCDGVTKLVEENRNKSDRVVIHNLNGHGIIIKMK